MQSETSQVSSLVYFYCSICSNSCDIIRIFKTFEPLVVTYISLILRQEFQLELLVLIKTLHVEPECIYNSRPPLLGEGHSCWTLFSLSLGGERLWDVKWEVTPDTKVAALQHSSQWLDWKFLLKNFWWWEFTHVLWSFGEVLSIIITSCAHIMDR